MHQASKVSLLFSWRRGLLILSVIQISVRLSAIPILMPKPIPILILIVLPISLSMRCMSGSSVSSWIPHDNRSHRLTHDSYIWPFGEAMQEIHGLDRRWSWCCRGRHSWECNQINKVGCCQNLDCIGSSHPDYWEAGWCIERPGTSRQWLLFWGWLPERVRLPTKLSCTQG